MMKPVLRCSNLWFILPLFLVLTSCAGVSRQTVQPTQIPQNVPTADVTNLIINSLRHLNYAVVEANPHAGYVRAIRYVPNDIWHRFTRMRVDVAQGQGAGRTLIVTAESCPGCLPMASYDPEFMTSEFNANFDSWARGAGLYDRPQVSQPSLQAPGSPNPRKTPAQATSPVQGPPVLGIHKVDINPGVVKAGDTFHVVADFSVADAAVRDKEIPVRFSFSVMQGQRILYSPAAIDIKGSNGGVTKRSEPVVASPQKGTYTIKVTIRYKELIAEESANLSIQ